MPLLVLIILFIFLLGAVIALIFSLNSLLNIIRYKVPYASTPDWAIEWLGKNLHLDTSSPARGEVARSAGGEGAPILVDLGCGDGRVLFRLKKIFPQVTMIGYERQWWLWLWTKFRARGTGVIIRRDSFYDADLANVSVVYCFLLHSVMAKVEKMLRTKLKKGATVYSYGFSFPTWTPIDQIPNPTRPQGSKLNVYQQS